MREMYTLSDPKLRKAVDPGLLKHRDYIYETYLELPVDL
jgi:hypothetical protein